MVSTKEAVETSLEHYGGVITGLTDRAEDAAERAEAAADRAEGAEGGGGGGTIPNGSVTKPKLSQGVQASLDKADSAVQGDDSRLIDARTPTAHSHTIAGVDGLADALTGKASSSHSHTIAGVEYLSDALDAKAPKNNPTFTGTVTTPAVKVTTGAGTGKVFTSDGDGVGSWQAAAGGGSAQGVVVTGLSAGAPPSGPTASGNEIVAIGHAASATNYAATAVGSSTVASGQVSTAVGTGAKATHVNSTAVGMYATTTANDQVMLGRTTQTVVAPNKFQIGSGTTMVTLSTRLTAGKAELIATLPSGKIISLGIDT
ncbi:hypothetical protein [Rhodococcus sp. NPDC055024]